MSALRAADAKFLLPGLDFAVRLLAKAKELNVSGVRMFDLQIGLTALDAGAAELWTHDRAFIAVPGLKVVDPFKAT